MRKLLLVFIFGILLAGSIYAGITINKETTIDRDLKSWIAETYPEMKFSYITTNYPDISITCVYADGTEIGCGGSEKQIIEDFFRQLKESQTPITKPLPDKEGVITLR